MIENRKELHPQQSHRSGHPYGLEILVGTAQGVGVQMMVGTNEHFMTQLPMYCLLATVLGVAASTVAYRTKDRAQSLPIGAAYMASGLLGEIASHYIRQ